jgi:hypothetical protein
MSMTSLTSWPIVLVLLALAYLSFTMGGAGGANVATNESLAYAEEKQNLTAGLADAKGDYYENTTARQRTMMGPYNYMVDMMIAWTEFGFEFGHTNPDAAKVNTTISPGVVGAILGTPLWLTYRRFNQ